MKHFVLIAAFIYPLIGWSQPYATGRRAASFVDASRSRVIATELFYPATTAGSNVPIAADTTHFPVVVFGHGFVIGVASYTWLADSLARNGFIVALPGTEGSLSPNHEQFGRDLAFLCERLQTLNDSAASFLYQKVRARAAVSGHSMGGGASFLATVFNSSVHALFNFSAAETNPSAKAAAALVQVPSLVFAGSNDCIVPDSNQQRMYQLIPYTCKSFVNITNALHCHFANNDGTCATGQLFSGCNSSSINAPVVFSKCMYLLVPFLNYYLKGDCSSANVYEERFNAITGVTKQRSCATDPNSCASQLVYTFTGSGNWEDAANWQAQRIPPPSLPAGSSIVIQPAANGVCVLSRQQTIAPGATLKVAESKQLIIEGDLIIQQ